MISLTDNKPKKDDTSTAKATKKAVQAVVPKQRTEPFPTNGELGGEFYFEKVISGSAEIPLSVHEDSYHEVIRMAEASGWLVTDDVYVAEVRNMGDRWEVFYAVPVTPNGEGNQPTVEGDKSTDETKTGK